MMFCNGVNERVAGLSVLHEQSTDTRGQRTDLSLRDALDAHSGQRHSHSQYKRVELK